MQTSSLGDSTVKWQVFLIIDPLFKIPSSVVTSLVMYKAISSLMWDGKKEKSRKVF